MKKNSIIKLASASVSIFIVCFLSGCATTTLTTPFEQTLGMPYEKFTQIIQENKDRYAECTIQSHEDIKKNVVEKWAIFRETRGAFWVEYDKEYRSRSLINVVAGYVEVEALVENDSRQAKKEACANLQRQLLAANAQCQRYLGFGFLSGLEGRVDVKTMANLPKDAFPQLYPVRVPKAPIKVPKSAIKSYLEEMRVRGVDPLAQSENKQAQLSALSSDVHIFDSKTALSQYVVASKKTSITPKVDKKELNHIIIHHIVAETTALPQDVAEKLHAKSIVSIKIAFPYNYVQIASEQHKDEIYAYSARFGLASNIVYAIMHTESYFNPFARSYSPAYGLMQLVPSSGGKDAYTYIYHDKWKPSPDYLYNPSNNIELGTAYISKVKDVYFNGIENEHNAYIATIAAYNTGPGNVAKALVGKPDIKKAIRIINTLTPQELYDALQKYLPYQETKDYLNYVMSRSELYYKK